MNLTEKLVLFALCFCIGVGIRAERTSPTPAEIAKHTRQNYCEMVRLRKESNDPSIGRPDYKGIYDNECNFKEE